MITVALVVAIALALVFGYTNGFHDAANAIASAISTRALTPRAALALAAVGNLAGSLLSTGVAVTVAAGIIDPPSSGKGMAVVIASLTGAIVWNFVTWFFGLPSSSSQALVGGMVGAGVAAGTTVYWISGVVEKIVVPMVLSPLIGLVLGYLLMTAVLWALRRVDAHSAERGFRRMQLFSAAGLAVGHGLQDAQKTMGVVVLALVTAGLGSGFSVPIWVVLICAAAIAAGTYSGGWRIMRTLGRRIFPLRPPHGFVAETTGSLVLYLTAFLVHAPISTTHVITASVMGVGSTRRVSAVRWGIAREIVLAWLFTFPAAALVAAGIYPLAALAMG